MDGGGGASCRKRGRKYDQNLKRSPEKTLIQEGQDFISRLPDECTQTIFGFLSSSRDRCACAAVCKRWLLLLAHMRGCQFNAFRVTAARTNASGCTVGISYRYRTSGSSSSSRKGSLNGNTTNAESDGSSTEVSMDRQKREEASRCLEAKEANDARLAAMAVGTYARKLLGKLSVRAGHFPSFTQQRITDFGLHIVSQSFPNLKALSLWDCFKVGSIGLASIAQCCWALEKLDISNLPRIDDDGLVPIAKNCPNLSTLTLDSCPLVGNRALQAIASCSSHLHSISITKCPLVGDAGIICMVSELPKLAKVRLAQLKLSNAAMHAIGEHRGSIRMLFLENLTGVSMAGFSWLGLAEKLEFLSINNCVGLTDAVLLGVGGTLMRRLNFACLRHVNLNKCGHLTDIGLSKLTASTGLLKTLKVECCDSITTDGIVSALKNCRTLKVLSIVRCASIKGSEITQQLPADEDQPLTEDDGGYATLESLTVKNCNGIDDVFLSVLAPTCVHVNYIALMGLTSITDQGLYLLLKQVMSARSTDVDEHRRQGRVVVSLSGCVGITDWSVVALARTFKGRLQSLSLDGCNGLGNKSLEVIGELCPGLAELDVSGCDRISDGGVVTLATAAHQKLEVLSLAGCQGITDRALSCLEVMCSGLVGLNLQHCRGVSRRGVDSVRATLWWCDLLY